MKKNILPIIVTLSFVSYCLFSHSCANTTTPPSGGPRDTIPPVITELKPAYNAVNVPLEKATVTFKFNEYVVLKNPNENIYLSPPQSKPVLAKIKGKSIVFTFQEPLDSNTTYSIDTGEAIQDNNEGNVFPKYIYSFSTGSVIDSLYTSGTVVDAQTMLPLNNITILFHTDKSDSAVFKTRPRASAKSDNWGFFTARNLKPESYAVYAIEDKNNNNKYDPADERIAFLDTLYIPSLVMHPDSLALKSLSVKDTAQCLARPSLLQLSLFKEVSSRQFLKNKERLSERMMYLKFAAPYVIIDSLSIKGISPDKILKQFNKTKDSLCLWINDQKPIADTLMLSVKYHKTNDSLKVLQSTVENLRMIVPKKKQEIKRGKVIEIKDSVARYKFIAEPESVEKEGFILEFDYPLLKAPFDSVRISYITPKQQVIKEKFTVIKDSLNIRRYVLMPENPLVPGNEYIIKMAHREFVDINGLPADSLNKRISLPKDEKLSTLTLDVQNVDGTYIVELISEKRDKVFRSYIIDKDSKLLFPYLRSNKYSVRIIEDKNRNGIIDTGSLLEKKQPEKVLLYRVGTQAGNEAYLLDIPEKTELEQTIDISKMFK